MERYAYVIVYPSPSSLTGDGGARHMCVIVHECMRAYVRCVCMCVYGECMQCSFACACACEVGEFESGVLACLLRCVRLDSLLTSCSHYHLTRGVPAIVAGALGQDAL